MKIYVDRLCKNPVDTIEWDNDLIINLVNGSQKRLPNTSKAGQTATSTVYVRNESKYAYAITSIKLPDKRLSISVEQDFLEPDAITKLTIVFVVPDKVTPDDVIKTGKFKIKGFHVYNPR